MIIRGETLLEMHSSNKNAAKTAFAFIISSVFSHNKDDVHVLPTCKMTADDLFYWTDKTVRGLEEIGFEVISVITDNN